MLSCVHHGLSARRFRVTVTCLLVFLVGTGTGEHGTETPACITAVVFLGQLGDYQLIDKNLTTSWSSVTLLITEDPSSNIGPDTGYPEGFRGFPQSLQTPGLP
jgi:hypothetical protein